MAIKVYYLDDESGLCDVFKEFIESDDIQVVTFTESPPAVSYALENPPDIMFIDYRLADTTGELVARKLDPRIPKILVTGELAAPDTKLFYRVVSKPYRLKQLKEIIYEVLKLKLN